MSESVHQQLKHYFPGETFREDLIEAGIEEGDILVTKDKILPYLQSSLLDEKVLEVELDGMPRIYFSRVEDDPPDMIEEEIDGAINLVEPEYTPGDYLKNGLHLHILPLEPGLGNLHLRHSRFIVLRVFTASYAVEICTSYIEMTKVRDIPILKVTFPTLARIVRSSREFRAKVPDEMDLVVNVGMEDNLDDLNTGIVNISVRGLSFSVTKKEQQLFSEDNIHPIKIYLNDELLIQVEGTIRHLSKLRKNDGIEYICGVQLDLATKTIASVIESIVATVQRAHLKEIADKSDATGLDLIA